MTEGAHVGAKEGELSHDNTFVRRWSFIAAGRRSFFDFAQT